MRKLTPFRKSFLNHIPASVAAISIAGFPTDSSPSFVTNNATNCTGFTDNYGITNNTLNVNTANAKTLGLMCIVSRHRW